MINYILLVITIACTIFNVWLTLKDRQGYDKGLEDGIRMTNEVLEEDQREVQTTLCRECDDYAGDGMICASNYIVYDFSISADNCEAKQTEPQTDFEDKPYLYRDMDGYLDEWEEGEEWASM